MSTHTYIPPDVTYVHKCLDDVTLDAASYWFVIMSPVDIHEPIRTSSFCTFDYASWRNNACASYFFRLRSASMYVSKSNYVRRVHRVLFVAPPIRRLHKHTRVLTLIRCSRNDIVRLRVATATVCLSTVSASANGLMPMAV
jgi:hypothetical protein